MSQAKLRKWLIGEFSFKRFVKSILFVLFFVLMFTYSFTDKMIFYPPAASYDEGSGIVRIDTGDGEMIAAMYFESPESGYTILFSHGNAEDIGQNREFFELLSECGFSVLAYDYRGYGLSDGRASEKHTYQDIEAAYDYLTGTLKVSGDSIIVLGRSVGAGPSLYLATKEKFAGLILESPFTSAFRIVTRVRILPFDKFDNLSRIKKVDCPVLVMHGEADNIVPTWHGKKVYEAANQPKMNLWVEGAGHNDLFWKAGDRYLETLEKFVSLIEGQRPE